MCTVLCELGDLFLSLGNTEKAFASFQRMRGLIPSGEQELLALAHYGLARVCAAQGNTENARVHGNESVTIFEAMKHRQAIEVRGWIESALG